MASGCRRALRSPASCCSSSPLSRDGSDSSSVEANPNAKVGDGDLAAAVIVTGADGYRVAFGIAEFGSETATPQRLSARDSRHMRDELIELADNWRRVLADDPTNARPIVSSLLIGRVTFTPLERRDRWQLTGEGTLVGLFRRVFAVTAAQA